MRDAEAYQRHLERGYALLEIGRFDDCVSSAGQAIATAPDEPDGYRLLSHANLRLGHKKEALQSARQALAFGADRSDIHSWHALVLAELGKKRQAIHAADESIKLDPADATAYVARAAAFDMSAKWVESERDSRRALVLDPTNLVAKNILAQSLRLQKRRAESDAIVKSILSDMPHDSFALTNATWLAMDVRNMDAAAQYIQSALACDPTNEFAQRTRREFLRRRFVLYRWEHDWRERLFGFTQTDWKKSKWKYAVVIPHAGIILMFLLFVIYVAILFYWALARCVFDYLISVDRITRQSFSKMEWYKTLAKGLIGAPILLYVAITVPLIRSSIILIGFIILFAEFVRAVVHAYHFVMTRRAELD